MKMKNEIFNAKMLRAIGVVAVLCASNAAFAASNGCDKDDADYISPTLALCSTHVYNIGETENTKDSAKKQEMRETIALKTTVMTQQMYQQYEYLDAMVKRFRTQLEKAVLKTKLAAAGADTNEGSTSGSLSFKSSDRNIFIAGVSNCNNELTNQKVFECLNTNLNSIYNASNNGQNVTTELKKQLANDYSLAIDACATACTQEPKCKESKDISTVKDFRECLDKLRSAVRTGYENSSQKQQQQNMRNWNNPNGQN